VTWRGFLLSNIAQPLRESPQPCEIPFALANGNAGTAIAGLTGEVSELRGLALKFFLGGDAHMMKMLTDDEARKLFQVAKVVRLGCIVNGEPYVVPINCHLEGEYLYSHSLPGLKISGLRENPRACVQVDEIESDLCWRSAIAFGKFEEVANPNERANVLGKLLRNFPLLTPVESAIAADGTAAEVIVFRIRIERVTGISES
jgi:nitroimidazol reductase NimA-like FMN-containing flavoprotein (pyridoxamine 5'-phosphate oxidase superfamily)